VFDRNPSNYQPGFYVFLNTGNGFDSGKQWQSNLGGDENWKNRTSYQFSSPPKLLCHCLPESKPLPVFRNT
jgi:hypothetical protein